MNNPYGSLGIGRLIGSSLAAGALVLGAANADANTIELDWRLNITEDPVNEYQSTNVGYLVGHKTLDTRVTGSEVYQTPDGLVRFTNLNNVPAGYRLWFFDDGNQPVGTFALTVDGSYNMDTPVRLVFGDQSNTSSIDEGAAIGDLIKVIAQSPDNRYWASSFNPSFTFQDNPNPTRYDVTVSYNEIRPVPEPGNFADVMLLLGIPALAEYGRRSKQRRQKLDLDPRKLPVYDLSQSDDSNDDRV
jgi:hypothetical protein